MNFFDVPMANLTIDLPQGTFLAAVLVAGLLVSVVALVFEREAESALAALRWYLSRLTGPAANSVVRASSERPRGAFPSGEDRGRGGVHTGTHSDRGSDKLVA